MKDKRPEEVVCLTIVDVDHFKIYNDTHGHPAGDRLLKSLGWLFKQWKTGNDTVYRIGGEEFVIVTRRSDAQSCTQQIQKLRTLVESFPFDQLNGNGKHVTVSIGAALPNPDVTEANELYMLADRRLYEAKKQRNTVVFAD